VITVPRRAPRGSPARAAFCLAWSCCAPAAAEAGESGAVAVEIAAEGCEPAFVQQIAPLLRVELGDRLESPGAQPPPGIQVALQCVADELAIDAQHEAGPARIERVNLAETPSSLRPRVAALRVAEIVRALDQAAARPPPRASRPANPVVPPPAREPAAEPTPAATTRRSDFAAPLELAVLVQASAFHGDDAWLWGGGVAADYRLGAVAIGGSAGFAQRHAESPLGETATWVAHVAPHAAWSLRAGRWQAQLGVGCALGLTWVGAHAQTAAAGARDLTAPWVAPHALAVLGFALTPATRLQLRAAAGWVVIPLIAEVERGPDIAHRGLWTQLQLGAALAL
jgi:hypothetical protein